MKLTDIDGIIRDFLRKRSSEHDKYKIRVRRFYCSQSKKQS